MIIIIIALLIHDDHHMVVNYSFRAAWQRCIMRVSREKAAQTRERIVEVAGALFRAKGFDGIGVADIMKAADLTHGGFYGHFGCKDDLSVERPSGRWRPRRYAGGTLSPKPATSPIR